MILVNCEFLIFYDAIGKSRASNLLFWGNFQHSNFTFGFKKEKNVISVPYNLGFQCSDITFGVKKDQNIESLIWLSTFCSFSNFQCSLWLLTFWFLMFLLFPNLFSIKKLNCHVIEKPFVYIETMSCSLYIWIGFNSRYSYWNHLIAIEFTIK